jgi:RNA polymerase sigma-70 factor, ECF subfamily
MVGGADFTGTKRDGRGPDNLKLGRRLEQSGWRGRKAGGLVQQQEEQVPAVGEVARAEALGGEDDAARAVGRMLAEHGDVLWRFVLGRVRSHTVAEDVVQETFLAALGAHARFHGGSTERTWLLGIASHKVANYFRSQRRRVASLAELDDGARSGAPMFDEHGSWSKLPGDWGVRGVSEAEQRELIAALRECIDGLPPAQAEVVMRRELLGVPTEEVCKDMQITPTNLWSRLHRARAALRACVERAMGLSA